MLDIVKRFFVIPFCGLVTVAFVVAIIEFWTNTVLGDWPEKIQACFRRKQHN